MAYELQIQHPSWQKCTSGFRGEMMERYVDLLEKENPYRINQVYKSIIFRYWYQ